MLDLVRQLAAQDNVDGSVFLSFVCSWLLAIAGHTVPVCCISVPHQNSQQDSRRGEHSSPDGFAICCKAHQGSLPLHLIICCIACVVFGLVPCSLRGLPGSRALERNSCISQKAAGRKQMLAVWHTPCLHQLL
eukprot:628573-Pelagomonas_calceolata.AAC.2